jgi:biopolymer transport protein ExbB/biopolymer transport protein TolQ
MELNISHLWGQMTGVAKAVVFIMILMSIWSLYVSVERVIFYRKAKKESLVFAKQVTQLLSQDRVQDAIDASRKHKNSHLARVTRAGLIEFQHVDSKPGALSGEDVVEAARRAIERESLVTYSDFKKGTGGLATIATTAPFVGLFGTVIGIINAFTGMALTGSGGIAAVSAGIAEALIATAIGLGVAIPAAWMFNYFTNVLERFQVEMSNSASELLDFFIKRHGGAHAIGVRK